MCVWRVDVRTTYRAGYSIRERSFEETDVAIRESSFQDSTEPLVIDKRPHGRSINFN